MGTCSKTQEQSNPLHFEGNYKGMRHARVSLRALSGRDFHNHRHQSNPNALNAAFRAGLCAAGAEKQTHAIVFWSV